MRKLMLITAILGSASIMANDGGTPVIEVESIEITNSTAELKGNQTFKLFEVLQSKKRLKHNRGLFIVTDGKSVSIDCKVPPHSTNSSLDMDFANTKCEVKIDDSFGLSDIKLIPNDWSNPTRTTPFETTCSLPSTVNSGSYNDGFPIIEVESMEITKEKIANQEKTTASFRGKEAWKFYSILSKDFIFDVSRSVEIVSKDKGVFFSCHDSAADLLSSDVKKHSAQKESIECRVVINPTSGLGDVNDEDSLAYWGYDPFITQCKFPSLEK